MTTTLSVGLPQIPDVRPTDALTLIKNWFTPDDLVCISAKRVNRVVNSPNVLSQYLTARELVNSLLDPSGENLLDSLCYIDNEPMDVYINVGAPRAAKSMEKRVKEEDLDRVIGVVADLDVKDSGFSSTDQIYDFLATLEAQPTLVVASGSGGVHAWWKFSDAHILPSQGKDIMTHWWTHLNEKAQNFNAQVDKLVDTARMFRLPGTLHWPRNGVGYPTSVSLSSVSGQVVSALRLMEISQAAWGRRVNARASIRKTEREMQLSLETLDNIPQMMDGGRWESLLGFSQIEDWFNEHVGWEQILIPAGWTFTRIDGAERQEWGRPGREGEKSACVAWPESPDVMSLLSTSADTGLLDLLDAEIVLTKWRVALRLLFNDDYDAMVKAVLNSMRSRT